MLAASPLAAALGDTIKAACTRSGTTEQPEGALPGGHAADGIRRIAEPRRYQRIDVRPVKHGISADHSHRLPPKGLRFSGEGAPTEPRASAMLAAPSAPANPYQTAPG